MKHGSIAVNIGSTEIQKGLKLLSKVSQKLHKWSPLLGKGYGIHSNSIDVSHAKLLAETSTEPRPFKIYKL